ncbi:MAG: histidine kinase [Gammaproteobacteria bacterium]|nr:histidine kinase [Gammaproteobacteria bacterium]
MGIELWWLLAGTVAYLGLLFLIAYSADSGLLPKSIISSPLIYTLSLGVYATSWTYYGSVGLANTRGYAFLTIYLGVTFAFLLGPYLLKPILRLSQEYQLTSIADLLAFRYGGRRTGLFVTLFMLIGILPYISLQINAVTKSVQVLTREAPTHLLALGFCLMITVFAILFGSKHLSQREKHHGLVVAIAFESAIKLIALLVAGFVVVTQVFDSPIAMNDWVNSEPAALGHLYEPTQTALWSTYLLLAFCAAFLLPRQYHMTFVENENPRHLNTAYWCFPLYLLLLNLPIMPILFAGRYLELGVDADFYVLGITQSVGSEWLSMLVFLGGVSAASAMMIVTTLSLSYMCLNHLLLPASLTGNQPGDFYQRLVWSKRVIIALIIAGGYGFYIVIEFNQGLASLGLISFVAAAQLLPAVIGLLFWSRATRIGLYSGLLGGATVWFVMLILPLLVPSTDPLLWAPVDTDIWSLSTFCSLTVNGTLFILGSLLRKPTAEELSASYAAQEQSHFAIAELNTARSVVNYQYAMQEVLGNKVAASELNRALSETQIEPSETRPAELRMLHEQLERNLTGLVGPTMARTILEQKSAGHSGTDNEDSRDARLLELRLEASREQMQGMTKQLDDLRRYLREVLRELPLGVCSIESNGTIYLWNSAMQTLTGISERQARDTRLDQLGTPWNELLSDFAHSDHDHQIRCHVPDSEKPAAVNLHKAYIGSTAGSLGGQVILMEDQTNIETLEAELAHSERLASIGRLAAGVAHEIGNPLTGIASIAQNLLHDSQHKTIDGEIKEQADDIIDQVDRINTIVRSLLTFSHADVISGAHVKVDLKDSINEALRLIQLSPEHRLREFNISLSDGLVVLGDANQLVQVFVNLISNACDASQEDSEIDIQGSLDNDRCEVSVADQGPGISAEIREQIFEPFFTTKAVGSGTGLGLSLVYSIVANHEGRVRIDESYSSGTRMLVTFPVADTEQ